METTREREVRRVRKKGAGGAVGMTKYTAFRCPLDLLEMARERARGDRRSLSNYLITLIEKDVGVRGSPDGRGARRPRRIRPKAGAED